MFANGKRRNRWLDNQAVLNGGRRRRIKLEEEKGRFGKGWHDPRDGRGRKDALFRFFYSIMQINVRYIKLSTGMAKGRQSRETIFMLLRKQKSAGANLSFLPSLSTVPFLRLCCSLSLPHERRNFWHGASMVGGYEKGATYAVHDGPAYVSRKREILHSKTIVSPCNYSRIHFPSSLPSKFHHFETISRIRNEFAILVPNILEAIVRQKFEFEITTHVESLQEKRKVHLWQISGSATNFRHSRKYPSTGA